MNNKIIKLQQGNYFKWKNLSREDKVKRNKQIAKQYLDKGPSIQNYYNALKAYFGGFNPKNPYLQTGEPIITPGMNPTKGVQTAAKAVRTLEDYLKTTKVTAPALEGSSMARSAYATDRYIGGRIFQNTLPDEAMSIQGHGMAKSPTIQDALARLRYILDNGIKGKFYTAPLKVSKEAAMAGEAIGTGGATPYFDGHFLITGKSGQMINSVDDIGTVYINDAYENEEALKAAQKMKEYLTKTYPNKVFKLYSEGFKKGGSIKAANARKWKHKEGGIIKAQEGTKTSGWQKGLDFLNSDTGKGILNLGSSLISGIRNTSKVSDYEQNFDNATNATAQAMQKKQYAKNKKLGMQYAQQYINYLNQMNPDQHFGEIDKQMLSEQFAKQLVNEDDINEYKAQRAQEKAQQMQAIQGSGGTNWLSQGLGLVGNFIGPKKTPSTTDNNSTTNNNLLNYNNIGKSTNPYMNTGLGGYMNFLA